MAKKTTLDDHKKRVETAELDLMKLYDQEQVLDDKYKQDKAKLAEKIRDKQAKLSQAETERDLFLIKQSRRSFDELEAFLLNQEGGRTNV